MKLFNTIALAALAVPFSQAMLMHIDSVQCGHMNVAFNGTTAEIAAIPDYASVTVNGEYNELSHCKTRVSLLTRFAIFLQASHKWCACHQYGRRRQPHLV